MKFKNIYTLFLICIVTSSIAQDIHFSNPQFTPLVINPGLTGMEGDIQLNTSYRSQWNSVANAAPFTTIAASGEFRYRPGNSKTGYLGIGVNLFNDRAGVNRISTNVAGINAAYHILLNPKSTLGIGIQTAFGQRTLDGSSGKFGSQYNGLEYDSQLSSGEFGLNAAFNYFAAHTGVVYAFGKGTSRIAANDNFGFTAGYAVFNVNRPNFSFTGGDDQLYMRHALFARSIIGISSTNYQIEPAIYMQFQGPSSTILMGADYKVGLKESSRVTGYIQGSSIALGLFYRTNDAIVTRVMYNYSGLDLGFSYDFTTSSLQRATNTRGGAEVFLRWLIKEGVSSSKTRI